MSVKQLNKDMYINISLSTVNDRIFLSFVVICFSQQDESIISTSDLDLLKKGTILHVY